MSSSKNKEPFSPSSLNLSMEKTTEQTKSPRPASNMMAAWLSKSASKKEATKTVISPKKEVKKKDENAPPPAKKSMSSKLAGKFEDEDEVVEEKPVSKNKEAKKSKKEKTPEKFEDSPPAKKSKVTKPEAVAKDSKAKVVIDDAKEKTDKNAAAIAKEKKAGNKFYAAYMRREGPKNPGSKPVPIGKTNCFKDLKFLVTGVLDSMDRDDCKKIVEKYGGSCISGVTKKLDYLVVGKGECCLYSQASLIRN